MIKANPKDAIIRKQVESVQFGYVYSTVALREITRLIELDPHSHFLSFSKIHKAFTMIKTYETDP